MATTSGTALVKFPSPAMDALHFNVVTFPQIVLNDPKQEFHLPIFQWCQVSYCLAVLNRLTSGTAGKRLPPVRILFI